MPTKAECIKAAAVVAAEGYRVLFMVPLEEAARRAARPGGLSYEEQVVRIAAIRAAQPDYTGERVNEVDDD